IDFSDGPFVLGSVDETDVDIASTTGDFTVAADCLGTDEVSASFGAGPVLTLTFCAGDGGYINSNGTTTIKIGNNATFSGDSGDANAQMTNPAVGSYQIPITIGGADSGETRVAIINTVTVSASVDTTFDFTVRGVAPGTDVNGTTTTGSSSPLAIDFGLLEAGVASTAAQNLDVVTNATNGFVVTVQVDHQLLSSTGADIDGFRNGGYDSTPQPWEAPNGTIGNENNYGHWGVTSEDASVGAGLADSFGTELYASASTTPLEVFRHNGPADGTTVDVGTTQVGYTVQITTLQEAGDDYNATLTYVATPIF
ncbi:hypothetical protein KC723_02410, partial [Candidatus Kaiserbacteria bacterium]|nr:hypothetical protein [Candidatus Kaiserbacteria bacterium]